MVIWNDLGDVSQGVTEREVALFESAVQRGIPLYFIGEKLLSTAGNLPAPQRSRWTELVRLEPAKIPGSGGLITLNGLETFHPALRGRFGIVQDFVYPGTLEAAAQTGSSPQVLGQSGDRVVFVASPYLEEAEGAVTRVITQTFRVVSGSDADSLAERKKLFQNAVCWLMRCPSCGSIDLRLEMSAAVEPAKVGVPFAYDLTVFHGGECEGAGIAVTSVLPPQVAFVSAETAEGTWTESAGVVTFKVGHVPNGSITPLRIMVRPIFPGTITNTARLRSFSSEVTFDNNSSSVVTTIEGTARPVLQVQRLASGPLQLQVLGVANTRYVIQATTNLVEWQPWTNFLSAGQVTEFIEPAAAQARQRFFRVLVP